ncbi:hypothetical protein DXG01_011049 [Tephrocybe rancida]|nr:hypothetical protein DXG01_011049 [Tephrocybe rancida]
MKLANHIAYFEALPDSFKDFASKHVGGKGPNKIFLAHCNREMYHEQWRIILDDKFIAAYEHGIVIQCLDGIARRFYPRILTYSADYPENASRREKVASARRSIYKRDLGVNSKPVEDLLKDESLVPALNAFSDRLAPFGFNFFQMLVIDILHDWEIGAWKAVFVHLIRILHAADVALVHELDKRFRKIPTFGRDTIRKFSVNTSEMKKLAAHNYEDILQCAIPAFDGLLPEPHNSRVLDILFICGTWHSLAKLRMHTDLTLTSLDEATRALGSGLRRFVSTTCASFSTRELPREAEARARRAANEKKNVPPAPSAPGASAQRAKTLNLDTYKFHALRDVAGHIREFGTTDSYSTEIGELEHRAVKARYSRTDRKEYTKQVARIERRQARVQRIARKTNYSASLEDDSTVNEASDPERHHFIGKTENLPIHIGVHVNQYPSDPAVQDFIPRLKKHLLSRIQALVAQENALDGTPALNDRNDWQSVFLRQDRIYRHNIMRVHYTSYDVRRSADVINVNTSHCNVMAVNPDFTGNDGIEHPYLYARVLGIYHANVIYLGNGRADHHPRRIEFLWVRWYTFEGNQPRRLERLSFPPPADEHSFGFIAPNDVLRGSHLAPGFSRGKPSHEQRGALSVWARDHEDWQFYYVMRFCDRDMFMRYHGQGVGHIQTQNASLVREHSADPPIMPDEDIADELDDGSGMLATDGVSDTLADAVQDSEHSNIEGDPDAEHEDALGADDMVFCQSDQDSDADSVEGQGSDADDDDNGWMDE